VFVKSFRFAAALVVSAVIAALTSVSANAETARPPDCLSTTTWDGPIYAYVKVVNRCGSHQRFRVIWEGATDSQCVTLAPDESFTDSAVEPAWFAGLSNC
jgi:hypothetical protein